MSSWLARNIRRHQLTCAVVDMSMLVDITLLAGLLSPSPVRLYPPTCQPLPVHLTTQTSYRVLLLIRIPFQSHCYDY
ncbi:hypothetical protein BDF22DRAFT_673125 [Syncephalis plumigaleata]|nr:hypothetical protein BDF22DRAFT_673125 [Syncephalis plumigaleata]